MADQKKFNVRAMSRFAKRRCIVQRFMASEFFRDCSSRTYNKRFISCKYIVGTRELLGH